MIMFVGKITCQNLKTASIQAKPMSVYCFKYLRIGLSCHTFNRHLVGGIEGRNMRA